MIINPNNLPAQQSNILWVSRDNDGDIFVQYLSGCCRHYVIGGGTLPKSVACFMRSCTNKHTETFYRDGCLCWTVYYEGRA